MSHIKIAFFVEGYTEQYFVEKLLSEIFNSKEIAIEIKSIRGGKKTKIKHSTIKSANTSDDTKFYVLIYNCGGDSSIKSYILEHRENLIKANYTKIIGVRDLYPDFKREEIQKLRKGLNYGVPQKDVPIEFILSVMEIESVFLAESTHFQNINPALTNDFILNNFGYDLSTFNTELIDEPANTLNSIYLSVGEEYRKNVQCINRTIESIDFGLIYLEVRTRLNSLEELISSFESILV